MCVLRKVYFFLLLDIYMKLILKLINTVTDLPKVAKSSYPSSRNSQALPIVTATSEKQETWFYRFKRSKTSGQ